MQYKLLSKTSGRILLSLALFLLPLVPSFGQSAWQSVYQDLGTQIENLKLLEANLSKNDSELTELIAKYESLKLDLENSMSLTENLKADLSVLEARLTDYLSRREIILNNFDGLLNLSRKYRQSLKDSETLNWILAGALALVTAIAIFRK